MVLTLRTAKVCIAVIAVGLIDAVIISCAASSGIVAMRRPPSGLYQVLRHAWKIARYGGTFSWTWLIAFSCLLFLLSETIWRGRPFIKHVSFVLPMAAYLAVLATEAIRDGSSEKPPMQHYVWLALCSCSQAATAFIVLIRTANRYPRDPVGVVIDER